MQSITRRNALTTVAAIVAVPAGPVAALALTEAPLAAERADAELRRLWARYRQEVQVERAAYAVHRPNYDACMAKAEERYPGDGFMLHWDRDEFKELWRSFGLDETAKAWDEAASAVGRTIEAIRGAKADGLVGIGVKLAAMEAQDAAKEDREEAMASALADIARITGVDLNAEIEEVQS